MITTSSVAVPTTAQGHVVKPLAAASSVVVLNKETPNVSPLLRPVSSGEHAICFCISPSVNIGSIATPPEQESHTVGFVLRTAVTEYLVLWWPQL